MAINVIQLNGSIQCDWIISIRFNRLLFTLLLPFSCNRKPKRNETTQKKLLQQQQQRCGMEKQDAHKTIILCDIHSLYSFQNGFIRCVSYVGWSECRNRVYTNNNDSQMHQTLESILYWTVRLCENAVQFKQSRILDENRKKIWMNYGYHLFTFHISCEITRVVLSLCSTIMALCMLFEPFFLIYRTHTHLLWQIYIYSYNNPIEVSKNGIWTSNNNKNSNLSTENTYIWKIHEKAKYKSSRTRKKSF